jgi:branched-chain amino acid transport system ATP-binding protein
MYWRSTLEKTDNILKISNVSVDYGFLRAVNDVSLDVNKGEVVVLLGSNGSGKSSLLKAILGLNTASSGTVHFLGKDITHVSTDKIVASGICLVPEGRGILPLMTVMENLELGAYYTKDNFKKYLDDVYKLFPILKERAKQMAVTLSGGQQQMLSIGRGMMSAPKLMMLDEPSLGLSPVLVNEIFQVIVHLKKEGHTILLSEQNARKALQIADRGYLFEKGNIVLGGPVKEIINDPKIKDAYLGGG